MERSPLPRLAATVAAALVVLVGLDPVVMAQERLRVEIDKAALVRLEKNASIVYVANPAIADVAVQSSRLIFVLGRAPGETSLRILDDKGKDILDSIVVVVPNYTATVTINRNEANRGSEELTFSCDPVCAESRTPTSQRLRTAPAAEQGSSSGGAGSAAGSDTASGGG